MRSAGTGMELWVNGDGDVEIFLGKTKKVPLHFSEMCGEGVIDLQEVYLKYGEDSKLYHNWACQFIPLSL